MPNNEEIDIINIWGLVFNLHQISQHAQVPHHSLPSSPFAMRLNNAIYAGAVVAAALA